MKTVIALALMALVIVTSVGCKTGTAGKVIAVQIQPSSVNAVVSTTVQFKANVNDTFQQGVNWSVVGGSDKGSISPTGLYTAPATVPTPAQVTVMAVSQKDTTKTATAIVTVTSTATPTLVTVTVTPESPAV